MCVRLLRFRSALYGLGGSLVTGTTPRFRIILPTELLRLAGQAYQNLLLVSTVLQSGLVCEEKILSRFLIGPALFKMHGKLRCHVFGIVSVARFLSLAYLVVKSNLSKSDHS